MSNIESKPTSREQESALFDALIYLSKGKITSVDLLPKWRKSDEQSGVLCKRVTPPFDSDSEGILKTRKIEEIEILNPTLLQLGKHISNVKNIVEGTPLDIAKQNLTEIFSCININKEIKDFKFTK